MAEKNHQTFKADNYCWQVRVKSATHLDDWISDYFSGLNLEHRDDGTTVLTGKLTDLPAVYGLILQLRDGGLDLLFLQVERLGTGQPVDFC